MFSGVFVYRNTFYANAPWLHIWCSFLHGLLFTHKDPGYLPGWGSFFMRTLNTSFFFLTQGLLWVQPHQHLLTLLHARCSLHLTFPYTGRGMGSSPIFIHTLAYLGTSLHFFLPLIGMVMGFFSPFAYFAYTQLPTRLHT